MNKIRTILGFLLVVGFASSVFGAWSENMKYFTVTKGNCYVNGNDGYGNVTYGCADTLYLRQSSVPCNKNGFDAAEGRLCVESSGELTTASAVNEAFQKIVSENWNYGNLVIDSDIDLGGFSEGTEDGKCDAQYQPLSFPENSSFFGGSDKGYKIQNLCYIHDVKDSVMSKPVGLFSALGNGQALNIAVKNVRFEIRDTRLNQDPSSASRAYMPVGAIFGAVQNSTVRNVSLEDVYIRAPMAGGVAGYAGSSSIRNVHGEDDLNIGNDLELTNENGEYVGYQWMNSKGYKVYSFDYAVFLGGVVGMAANDSIYDVGIRAKITDISSKNTPSALGGMAGVFAVGDIDYAAYNDTLLLKAETETSGTGFTTISGGTVMGGFFGEVVAKSVTGPKNFTIKKSRVDSVKIIESKAGDVYVGGFVGRGNMDDNGRLNNMNNGRLNIQKNYANVDIWNPAEVSGNVYVGGVCGECNSLEEISLTSVKGDIVIGAGFSGSSLFVGGLVGSSTGNNMMKISNTYSIGRIDVHEDIRAKSSTKVGYLFGSLSAESENQRAFISNYHFGADEELGVDGFGFISNGNDITGSWKSAQIQNWNFTYNVRNGKSQNLSASNNGEKPSSDMKTKLFAGQLNKNQTPVWSYDDGVNGGLPFFGDEAIDPNLVFTVTFYYDVWDAENKTYKQESYVEQVFKGDDAVAPAIPEKQGYTSSWDTTFTNISGDLSVHALYTINRYEVVFLNDDGSELQKETLDYGATPDYAGVTPEKAATAQYTYSFVGWDPEVVSVTGTATYTAKFDSTVNEYAIAFVNADGTELQNTEVAYDVVPAYAGEDPSKAATAQYTYSFAGWNPEVAPVTGTATYTAKFDSTVNKYAIAFVNADGTELQNTEVAYDVVPAYAGEAPSKAATAKYTYSFAGWNPEVAPVTGTATYTAKFDSTVNKYAIAFVNADGTELQNTEVAYDVVPAYAGEAPSKAATAKYTYSFAGWDPEVVSVTGTATYTAKFDSTVNKYLVTFKNGETVLQSGEIEYGVVPTAPSVTLPANTAQYTYSFGGWNTDVVAVTETATYVAVIDSTLNSYTVTFVDYDFVTVLDEQVVFYGASAKAPADPSREAADGIAYTFEKWSEDFSVVIGNMTVVAVYRDSVIPSSSSEEPQSSSSSEEPESSSSSIEPESSSSSVEPVEIVEPRIEQSGNAIRLTFGTNNFDVTNKTSARVVVLGDEGVYMDTVLTDSITDAAARGEWVLSPAPIGKFTVKLVLASDVAADSCEKNFTVSGEIEVQPRSWQMIALSALDMAALRDKDDAAFYWWDEVNPIGDYWQYRAYEESAEYNETQGFWYGTKDGNPLKLKAETPTQDAEIVWELDNRYSGWNLVANPHGWYVNMQDAEKCDAEFWRWNPVTAEYETVAILAPYEAIWAKVSAPTTCRISSAPDFSIAMEGAEEPETLAKKALAKSSKGMDWSLRAVLSDASGKRDSWNVIGSGNGSNMEEPPAGMGDHVNLSIVEGKSRFAKFVKAAAESYSWNMEVNASSARDGFLSFEGVETLAAKGMKVFVTVDGKTTEMTNGKFVPVSLKKDSKTVTVQVSKSAPVVSSNALKGLRAVQQGGSLQIGFNADGMNGSQGLVQLVGVNGKIAASSKFTAVGGANLVTVAAPKSGVYFLRVKVGSQMTSAKFLVK